MCLGTCFDIFRNIHIKFIQKFFFQGMEVAFWKITDIFTTLESFHLCKGKFAVMIGINLLCSCTFSHFGGTVGKLVINFFQLLLCLNAVFFICGLFKHCAVGIISDSGKFCAFYNIILAVSCRNINSTYNYIRTDTCITCTAQCQRINTVFRYFPLFAGKSDIWQPFCKFHLR